jgi:hypothetical protein
MILTRPGAAACDFRHPDPKRRPPFLRGVKSATVPIGGTLGGTGHSWKRHG